MKQFCSALPARAQPSCDGCREVEESQPVRLKPQRSTESREITPESRVMIDDLGCARQCRSPGGCPEPVSDFRDGLIGLSAVGVNILTGNVGDKGPVAVRIPVQNQRRLFALIVTSKSSAPKKQPQLQGHVEPRQVGDGIELDHGEIVYAELAFFDDPLHLCQADIAAIVFLAGAAGNKAEVANGEDNGFEDRPVTGVEGTVDEDVFTSQARGHCVEANLTSVCREQLYQPLWQSFSPSESSLSGGFGP